MTNTTSITDADLIEVKKRFGKKVAGVAQATNMEDALRDMQALMHGRLRNTRITRQVAKFLRKYANM